MAAKKKKAVKRKLRDVKVSRKKAGNVKGGGLLLPAIQKVRDAAP